MVKKDEQATTPEATEPVVAKEPKDSFAERTSAEAPWAEYQREQEKAQAKAVKEAAKEK